MELQEPAIAYGKRKYTIQEYLEMENASLEKHEYYQGEIFSMAGAGIQHNIIAKNILSTLDKKLSKSPCQPFNSDTRIYIEQKTLFTYPDVSIICNEPITFENDGISVLNPSIIFEVLSPSTKDYDRKGKFLLYRNIKDLKTYILVESDAIKVEVYHINKHDLWEMKEYSDINEYLRLPSIPVNLTLKEIYKKTKLISTL
jgi:Uma2 family endonuclease